MANYKVKNLNGTSDNKLPVGYDSWIDYWSKVTGEVPLFCAHPDCLIIASHGAHVKLVDSSNNAWYITPLCPKHNLAEKEVFFVSGPLAPVNPSNPILR